MLVEAPKAKPSFAKASRMRHTDANGIDDLESADLVHAQDAGVVEHDVFEGLILVDLGCYALQNLHHSVGVFAGVHGNIQRAG
jgi:hypothetical protein